MASILERARPLIGRGLLNSSHFLCGMRNEAGSTCRKLPLYPPRMTEGNKCLAAEALLGHRTNNAFLLIKMRAGSENDPHEQLASLIESFSSCGEHEVAFDSVMLLVKSFALAYLL